MWCAQECRELVRQYVPEIMKAVVSLPEEQVCGAIGLCSAASLHTGVLSSCLNCLLCLGMPDKLLWGGVHVLGRSDLFCWSRLLYSMLYLPLSRCTFDMRLSGRLASSLALWVDSSTEPHQSCQKHDSLSLWLPYLNTNVKDFCVSQKRCSATWHGSQNFTGGVVLLCLCVLIRVYLWAGEAKAAASRRLLVEDEPPLPLGAPDPVCQFCEMAVSYVKVPML